MTPEDKDDFQSAGLPPLDTPGDDSPDWQDLDDVLEELGLNFQQFRSLYPHVGLDHRGWQRQVIIDINQLEEGGRP